MSRPVIEGAQLAIILEQEVRLSMNVNGALNQRQHLMQGDCPGADAHEGRSPIEPDEHCMRLRGRLWHERHQRLVWNTT